MRCNNCGFQNSQTALRCERCNYPISGSLNQDDVDAVSSDSKGIGSKDDSEDLNETVVGATPEATPWDMDNQMPIKEQKKPHRRTPRESPDPKLHSEKDNPEATAGGEDKTEQNENEVNKTQTPWNKTVDPSRVGAGLQLHRIPREGEEPKTLSFSKTKISLNRENTDPENYTITSKVQAVLEKKDGAWHLSDQSSLKTTYIRVKGKIELKPGDVILLGDRAFEVDF